MARIVIDDPSDPRLDPYRNLRDRVLRQQGGRFIAESDKVVRRLLESPVEVESLLLQADRADAFSPWIDGDRPAYIVSPDVMTRIAGFSIHTGVLAIGLRPPGASLDQLIEAAGDGPITLLIASQLKEAVNLGSLMRSAAALGATALLLGPRCCDPWYRRAIRVSMGAVFRLPVLTSDDLAADMRRLVERHHVALHAAVLSDAARPLHAVRTRPPRVGIALGHEVRGLDAELVELCQHQLTLPMVNQTDSLNVAVSGAVLLHHFTRIAGVR